MGYIRGMAQAAARAASCPPRFLEVDHAVLFPWPARLVRCPHCRLTIGPGRARESSEGAGPGARGTAARGFAHEARPAHGENASEDSVRAAIRSVAACVGSRPERLLMIDYQQRAIGDDSL